MTSVEQVYRFYNQSPTYLQRLQSAGWRPEYGAVLAALRRHGVYRGSRTLDYGCGVGDLTATLARAGYLATGADIAVPFLDLARARYRDLPFVALDPGPELPFGSQEFVAITAVNTIEHVPRPAIVLKELARLLRPGGVLAMTFPNLLSPLRPFKRFVVRRRPRYGPESGDSAMEALRLLVRNLGLLASISVTHRTQFRPRQADFANAERYRLLGYGADYDAVWLVNPVDIVWRLRELGLDVLQVSGIPGAAERHAAINWLRRLLPPPLTSPILLIARRPQGAMA